MPESDVQAVFIRRLIQARTALGLSQAALGREIGLADEVASARINRYERGAFQPDLQTAEAMAKALGVPLAWLVCTDPKLAAMIEAFAKLPPKAQDALLTLVEGAAAKVEAPKAPRRRKARAAEPGSTAPAQGPSRLKAPKRRSA